MKNIIIAALAFPISLHAMETSVQEQSPLKAMANIYQMNLKDLKEVTDNLHHIFQKLPEESLISLPFDPHQAEIIAYSYAQDPPKISDIQWELLSTSQDSSNSLNFFDLLHLYIHSQQNPSPPQTSFLPFKETPDPSIKLAFSYAEVAAKERLYENLPKHDQWDGKISLNKGQKICTSFAMVQSILALLPDMAIWDWIKLRYYGTKIAKGFGAHPQTLSPLFYKPISSLDLLTFDYEKNKDLALKFKNMETRLCEHFQLTLPHHQEDIHLNPKASIQKYREILKILFAEVPKLGVLELLENQNGFHEFFSFAQLYLDLTKNCIAEDEGLDLASLHTVLNKINGSDLTEDDVYTVMDSKEGRKNVKETLNVFINPFAPTIKEINTFSCCADRIMNVLIEAKKERSAGSSAHNSQEDQFDVFLTGVKDDLADLTAGLTDVKNSLAELWNSMRGWYS